MGSRGFKPFFFAVALYLGAFTVCSQNAWGARPSTPGKASLDQLTTCYDNLKICGADDPSEVTEEFARRLKSLPSERLVACFDNWKLCGMEEGRASGWPISDELARRGKIHALLLLYSKERSFTVRIGIEHVAYHFDNPEVTAFMRKVFAERVNDGENLYWPVNYLAKKCDPNALKELSSGRYRNQGSLQYQTSVELFGGCKYRPAIPYLISAMDDFSLNIADSAYDSLRALYPDSPACSAKTREECRDYFCGRAKKEGLQVKCEVAQKRQ